MEIRSGYVDLKVGDGTTMRAWTARPVAAGALPGLIVFQEAFRGERAHSRRHASGLRAKAMWRLRRSSFTGRRSGFEARYDDFPSHRAAHERAER